MSASHTAPLLLLSAVLAAGYSGIFPIPPSDLYEEFDSIQGVGDCELSALPEEEGKLCEVAEELRVDYACRYTAGYTSDCYCCGAIYSYVEHGDVCTRHCLVKRPVSPAHGQYPIINLPFNWGDGGKPYSARLEDGQPFPIIPVNARLSREIYGFAPEEEERQRPLSFNFEETLDEALQYFTRTILVTLTEGREGTNILFSPISLHSVLALLSLGTENESSSKQELNRALGLTANPNLLQDSYRKFTKGMSKQKKILYSNEIYLADTLTANADFTNSLYKNFRTMVSYMNLSDPEVAQKEINQLISEHTKGKIQDPVKNINIDTKMLFINTLLFQANWDVEFQVGKKPMKFTTSDGVVKQVEVIQASSDKIKHEVLHIGRQRSAGSQFDLIRIPYKQEKGKSNDFEMRIYLAAERFQEKGLEFLLNIMRQSDDSNIFSTKLTNPSNLDEGREVNVQLPKLALGHQMDVSEYLKQIGVESLFTSDSKLTKIATGKQDFSVGKILQEIFLSVDEKGTDAAAATIAEVNFFSASEPVLKIVDRPFILAIWDNTNNIPLIVGLINDPVTV